MSEEIGPCPVCDSVETQRNRMGDTAYCRTCHTGMPVETWQRLADAARLAAAVGRLAATKHTVTFGEYMDGGLAVGAFGVARGETAAAALVALAGEVGDA